MKQPKTSAKQIETAERRAYILELRKAGADYRTIAHKTIDKFGEDNLPKGFDERYAWTDVKRELDRLNTERAEDTLEIRTLELERLDRLLMAVYQPALKGDYAALDRVLKIMAQREKYIVGLTVPQKVQFEDITDREAFMRSLIALRDEGKLTPEIALQEFGLETTEELWPGTRQRIVVLNNDLANAEK